jgi:hypothetical protein
MEHLRDPGRVVVMVNSVFTEWSSTHMVLSTQERQAIDGSIFRNIDVCH